MTSEFLSSTPGAQLYRFYIENAITAINIITAKNTHLLALSASCPFDTLAKYISDIRTTRLLLRYTPDQELNSRAAPESIEFVIMKLASAMRVKYNNILFFMA